MKPGDRVRVTASAASIIAPASSNRTTTYTGTLRRRVHGGGPGWPPSSDWVVATDSGHETVADESMMEVIR